MLPHSAWWLVCDGLAVYRLAVLVTKDTVMLPLRRLAERPFRSQQQRDARRGRQPTVPAGWRWYLVELSTCQWCVSVWLAGVVVVLTRFYPSEWQYAAMLLALSAAAGFLGER